MSTSLVLRTAFDVGRYKNVDRSPVASAQIRLEQYIDGLRRFRSLISIEFFDEVFVVDNTLKSISDFDKRVVQCLPSSVKFLATGTNHFGRYNKGAGDLETYRYLFNSQLLRNEFTVHFEPRLKLIDTTIFDNFFARNRSLLCVSPNGNSIQTGYMFLASAELRKFCSLNRLLSMTLRQESIEDLIFKYAEKRNIELVSNYTSSLRIDPVTNNEVPY